MKNKMLCALAVASMVLLAGCNKQEAPAEPVEEVKEETQVTEEPEEAEEVEEVPEEPAEENLDDYNLTMDDAMLDELVAAVPTEMLDTLEVFFDETTDVFLNDEDLDEDFADMYDGLSYWERDYFSIWLDGQTGKIYYLEIYFMAPTVQKSDYQKVYDNFIDSLKDI